MAKTKGHFGRRTQRGWHQKRWDHNFCYKYDQSKEAHGFTLQILDQQKRKQIDDKQTIYKLSKHTANSTPPHSIGIATDALLTNTDTHCHRRQYTITYQSTARIHE